MEINFTITKKDLIDFHMKHVTETQSYKYAVIGYNIFLFLLFFLVFLISKHSYYTISVFILLCIFFIFKKKYMLWQLRKKFYKIFSFEKYNDYFKKTTLTIIESGLFISTDLSQKTYKWDAINNIYLLDNYIFITTSTHDDILIPISSFPSLENKEFFISNLIKNTELKLNYNYPIDFKYQ